MTAISGRRRRVANDKSRDRRRLDHGLAARLIGARRLPIGLAMVVRRPIDCLAILTASVASIVIIINAVFLQSGFRHGADQPEGLVSKLQKPQEFLKSEGKRLRRKIDSAVVGIKSMETRDEFAEFVGAESSGAAMPTDWYVEPWPQPVAIPR